MLLFIISKFKNKFEEILINLLNLFVPRYDLFDVNYLFKILIILNYNCH